MMGIAVVMVLIAANPYVDSSRAILRFYDSVGLDSAVMVSLVMAKNGVLAVEKVRTSPLKYMVVRLKKGNFDAAFDELSRIEGVKYVAPTVYYRASHTPNDLYWNLQWGPVMVHAPNAWDITTGDTGVVVAVVDEGVQYNHPDLTNSFGSLKGYDFVDNDPDPMPVSENEDHGTHVAGIIAAEMDNYIGIAGMAQVRLFSLRALGEDGSGRVDDIADGITWAVNHGARVINLSLGAPIGHYLLEEACQYAVDSGAVVFAAAGNDGADSVDYPARYPTVVAVSAIDPDSSIASYSNYGLEVELSAPGTNIYSTLPFNTYGYMSGTSMATPLVSGVAALLISENPALTPQAVRSILAETAMDFGPSGRDVYYGYGVVDAYAAVQAAFNYTVVDTLQNDNGSPYYYCANEWGPYIKASRFSVERQEQLSAILAYFGTPTGYTPIQQTGYYFIWSDNAGRPGSLIASGQFNLPPLTSDQWMEIDLSSLNINVSGEFWIGISQSTTSAPYLRQDTSSNPTRNMYSTDNGTTWSADPDGNYFIRAVVAYRTGVDEGDEFRNELPALALPRTIFSKNEAIQLQVLRKDVTEVRLFDAAGRLLKSASVPSHGDITVSTAGMAPGVYFVAAVAHDKLIETRKIVVR